MDTITINLPKSPYDTLAERAAMQHQNPERFVAKLLANT